MQYTVEQIKKILKADGRLATPDSKVTRLLTDSRSLSFPEETIFFAIKTKHGDGHKYINELYHRGVRNFVVNTIDNFKDLHGTNFIIVEDSLEALQMLATYHRSQFDIPVVGITGSDGKTIVKEWLYQLTAGLEVALRLDALNLAQLLAEDSTQLVEVVYNEVTLAILNDPLDNIVGLTELVCPLRDELTVTHVSLLNILAQLDTRELSHSAVHNVRSVLSLCYVEVRDKAELNHFRVAQVVECEEVCASLLEW